MAARKIPQMHGFDPRQMIPEHKGQALWESRIPILVPLSGPDGHLVHSEIHILYPKPNRFHDTQPTSVQKLDDELRGPLHDRNHRGHFFSGHDDRNPDASVGSDGLDAARQGVPQNPLIEENQCIHRLILGGRGHIPVDGQLGKECLDLGLGGEKVLTRPHSVKPNEPDDPVNVGPFSVDGIMTEAKHPPNIIKEPWLRALPPDIGRHILTDLRA